MKKNTSVVLMLSIIFLWTAQLSAQCFLQLPLETRLGQSEVIVSATVLSSTPFYNDLGRIATRHELEIHEIFLGDAELERLDVVTLGGQINESLSIVRPSLQLVAGTKGVFLLRHSRVYPAAYQPVAVQESLLALDLLRGTFADQGRTYRGSELSALLSDFTGQAPVVHQPMLTRLATNGAARQSTVTITSFTPNQASAGTGMTITVNGNGFGSTQGTLLFDNPDDGSGGQYAGVPPNDIISWSNTQIVATIPGQAGTGLIAVQSTNGMTGFSSSVITIDYAVITIPFASSPSDNARMIDDMHDGDGGYRFEYSNNTANAGVSFADDVDGRNAFERALESWQQDPGAEFAAYAGADCGVTSLQQPLNDGINVVSYDNNLYDFDSELGAGVLGVAFSDYEGCGPSEFELVDIDIFFRRDGDPNNTGGSVNWWFGDGTIGLNEVSFESTALHELGHAHQLAHVNDASELMNFSAAPGDNIITISQGASDGAAYIKNLALNYNPPIINCGAGNDFMFSRPYQTYDVAEDCGETAAPVSYLTFTGYRNKAVVELEWSTAFEQNNEVFIVQRSADGQRFSEIGRVAGQGNTRGVSNYAFTDTRPLPKEGFYRLAQRDFDGTVAFSKIIRVTNEVAKPADISIVPNPATDYFSFSTWPTLESLTLFDSQGRIVLQQTIDPSAPETVSVDISSLPTGVYWLKADTVVKRVVKQ